MTIYMNNNIHYGEWLRCKHFRAFKMLFVTTVLILVNSYTADFSIRGVYF